MIKQINFAPGDTVRVHQKVQEGEKTRIQVFEGVVLQIKGREENKSYTVRKIVGNIAVERIWPVYSPSVEKVVKKSSSRKKVRRAKLNYLKN